MLARFSRSYDPRLQYLWMRMKRGAITRLTAAQSTLKFVCGWGRKTAQYGGSVVDITLQFSPAAKAGDDETGGPPPTSARFPKHPPSRCRHRPRRSPNINNHLSSHRRPLPPSPEPNRAPRTTVTAPPVDLQPWHPSPPHPAPHAEEKHHQVFLLLPDAISRILLSVRISLSIFASQGT